MNNIFNNINNAVTELSDDDDGSSEEGLSSRPGAAIQKLRQFVAKNFLSVSLSELSKMDSNNMTMTYVLKLAFLTESMNELLPEGT